LKKLKKAKDFLRIRTLKQMKKP